MAGAMAFIGHCYPVWLRFAGGKGVATMMGVVTALYWPAGIVFAVVWLGALFGTKWSSVGGMAAAVSAPVALWCFGRIDLVPVALDRKSVVWGKSGSVRVDLGGRRIIKKKKID